MSDLYKNLVTQVVLYILRLQFFSFRFRTKFHFCPLYLHLQVFELLVQKLHVFQEKSILLEMHPFIWPIIFLSAFIDNFWFKIITLFQLEYYKQKYYPPQYYFDFTFSFSRHNFLRFLHSHYFQLFGTSLWSYHLLCLRALLE